MPAYPTSIASTTVVRCEVKGRGRGYSNKSCWFCAQGQEELNLPEKVKVS